MSSKHFHIALSLFTVILHPECLYQFASLYYAFVIMETVAQLKYHLLMKTWVHSQLKVVALSSILL